MIGAIILMFVLYGITQPLLAGLKKKHSFIKVGLLNNLFWYHCLFWLIYFLYTLSNRSDSEAYYARSSRLTIVDWILQYEPGTQFLTFFSFPFAGLMGFSFEMVMLIFSYIGYWGFVYFYIFFSENVKFNHKVLGYDLITVLMFLPNMHFWTASLGKGSLIFFGIGLATYGLSRIKTRKLAFGLGMLMVYHVRPHVFLFMMAGIVMGFFTGRQKVPMYQKILVVGGGLVAMFLLYEQILGFVGVDSENPLESFEDMTSHRASELAKAGSGVDISNDPLLFKLFTFWFRPLFFDAPGVLGIFVSAENLIYLVITAKLFDKKFIPYFLGSTALVKSSAVIFVASSIALSTTMSNLGIIIRQKSMVMYFFFFVILCFMDYKRGLLVEKKKKRLARIKALEAQNSPEGDGSTPSPTTH